jgi:molybdopterin-guanine dinucleotide biosynthesis protein A
MAGGKSSRLGTDKALLTLNGETLLARALRVLSGVTAEQMVIGPPERQQHAGGARVCPDRFPTSGPLGGIYTALETATHDLVLVVACDMPFLSVSLLGYLLTLAEGCDVVLPRPDGRGEQLHAVYRRSCLDPIKRLLESGDYKIDRFFSEVRVRAVDESELRRYDVELQSFRNVNTASDWADAQSLLARTQGDPSTGSG